MAVFGRGKGVFFRSWTLRSRVVGWCDSVLLTFAFRP